MGILRVLCVATVLAVALVTNVSAALVAHYEFDFGALDSSGHGLQGTFVGSAGSVFDVDRGTVVAFNGGTDHVNLGNSSLLSPTDQITLAAWVSFDRAPSVWAGIVTKGDSSWQLSTLSDLARLHFAITDPTSGVHSVDGDVAIAIGEWHHACATYDGKNMRLFLDGFEDPQSPQPYDGSIGVNSFDAWIGGNSQFPARGFGGMLDDVRIYNEGLSASEVAALAGRSGGDGDWIVSGHDMYAGVSGNVGIGTTNPLDRLHVVGLGRFDLGTGRIHVSTPGGWPGLIAFSANGHRRDVIFDDSSFRLLASASSAAPGAESGITIREDGHVGIGTGFPGTFSLAVNGSAAKPGGGSWLTFSDARLKEVGRSYDRGLEEISRLRPIYYRYREGNELRLPAGDDHIGVVAQEVKEAIPEAVNTTDKGYLTVDNDAVLWALVNAVNELKSENLELKQKLQRLEAQVNGEVSGSGRLGLP